MRVLCVYIIRLGLKTRSIRKVIDEEEMEHRGMRKDGGSMGTLEREPPHSRDRRWLSHHHGVQLQQRKVRRGKWITLMKNSMYA